MSIEQLTGNAVLEEAEIRNERLEDAGVRPACLPDDAELDRQMAESFGWDLEESPEETEAHYQSWLAGQTAA